MRICLVGGIFDRPEAVRSKQLVTPETVLLDGFRKAGVEVDAVGHARFQPSDDYDIIHVHHFGRAALKMASADCRARVVFTGHNGLIPAGRERSRLRRYAFQYVVDRAEAYIALSDAEARYYAGVTNADKIHTIPNGIPADVFRAAGDLRKEIDEERHRVLYVGQLIDSKGVDVLLEAMQQVRKQRDVRLRLVYHNAELEAELRRQAGDLGIAEHVEFVGIRGPRELAEEYHQADLLVLPRFAECLPSVVPEALLGGTPVGAGGVGGVPEQIGPYGLAVPPGDVLVLRGNHRVARVQLLVALGQLREQRGGQLCHGALVQTFEVLGLERVHIEHVPIVGSELACCHRATSNCRARHTFPGDARGARSHARDALHVLQALPG